MKKLQNENKQANISSMQTAGKKKRPTIDNLIIINVIIEKQRQEIEMIEMERIRHNKGDIKMIYEINKTTEIAVDIATGNTEIIKITEVVK